MADFGEDGVGNAGFATDSLENMRRRLLDLSGRNRLLNLHHGRSGHIRVVDELPDQLHELLLDEKLLYFKPVPEPTEEELIRQGYIGEDGVQIRDYPTAPEWAKVLGFATDYELPTAENSRVNSTTPAGSRNIWIDSNGDPHSKKHSDNAIQTLLYAAELEARLRGIHSTARTAIQESGANILYLAFGFLEWYESKDSEKSHIAPLYLVPVQLEQGKIDAETGTYIYTLSYTGEDIVPNLSLREKLKQDYGLVLPELDNETKPEKYFKEVSDTVLRTMPRWGVKRFCTLSHFHFGKLLMYLDLDPARWPERSILDHALINSFFGAGGGALDSRGSSEHFGHERDIDSTPEIHGKYPLIDDADSSQYSALMDAIDGKNLVIEGPPGTGKSQTITNLIAAALAKGKKVLFVAEKLAALEVVKARLDRAGLGDFCLELHSHKTQKRRVLDDLKQRLDKRGSYRLPVNIDADIARYEELKDKLRLYTELINSKWKKTGMTCHEILMRGARYRADFDIPPRKLHPKTVSGDSFTPQQQRSHFDDIRTYSDMCRALGEQLAENGKLLSHPWFGVCNCNLQTFDATEVCALLGEWQASLEEVRRATQELASLLGASGGDLAELPLIEQLTREVSGLPELHGDELLHVLPKLKGVAVEQLKNGLLLYRAIQHLYYSLELSVDAELLNDLSKLDVLVHARDEFCRIGVPVESDFKMLDWLAKEIRQLRVEIDSIASLIAEMLKHFPNETGASLFMSKKGLSELVIFFNVVNRLPARLWTKRNILFENTEVDRALTLLKGKAESLRSQRDENGVHFDLNEVPSLDSLKRIKANLETTHFLRWLKRDWRESRRALMSLALPGCGTFKKIRSYFDALIKYISEKDKFEHHSYLKDVFGDYFIGLDTDEAMLQTMHDWYSSVRNEYGFSIGPRVHIGEAIIGMDSTIAAGIQVLSSQGIVGRLEDIREGLAKLSTQFTGVVELQLESVPVCGDQGPLAIILRSLEECLLPCRHLFKKDDLSFGRMIELIGELQQLKTHIEKWNDGDCIRELFGDLLTLRIGLGVDNVASVLAAEHTLQLGAYIESNVRAEALTNAIYSNPTVDFFNKLKSDAICLHQLLLNAEDHYLRYEHVTELSRTAWCQSAANTLDALLDRNRLALAKPDWFASWLNYIRVRNVIWKDGYSTLVGCIEDGTLNDSQIVDAWRLGVYDRLSREIFAANRDLEIFSGTEHNAIRERFCEYDEKLKALQCEKIASIVDRIEVPAGNRSGRVSTLSDLGFIQHECNKKRKHQPIRELVKKSGHALVALKPCFMMGPMSVAQYLAPGQLEFDLVVMDEASQIKPQDALGVIARGIQLVVVGDPKQLPPTSFFDRVVDKDEEKDNVSIEESESILDAVLPLFDARRLRWHYRSRHESLIAFSNYNFYDGDLVVFPSPQKTSNEYGVKFKRIKKGCFINRRNIEEARVIAEAVADHLQRNPDETLGVVAMNIEQRDQIEQAIEEVCKRDPLTQAAIEWNRSTEAPLFVKNLENVQGDERDVIFISFTYGPSEIEGQVQQRFGPINSEVGWRRLNVLFTRSKKRMHVFSSMGSQDIVTSATSSRGVLALKKFLAYAETGMLQQAEHTGMPCDSDFEVAVLKQLAHAGFECEPQVGVAGYFIDLAVKDPGRPGRYLIGIECDGATYHSAKSVRDRDRLRQTVLEQLGWKIRRIWSTDWFRNSEQVLEPIIQELHRIKSPIEEVTVEKPEIEESENVVKADGLLHETPLEQKASGYSLREALVTFDATVVRVKYPHTQESKRLLSPAMLNAFLHFRPATMSEFREWIPQYLRYSIDLDEAEFLNQILEIIALSESEVVPENGS
ncbi:MAG: DUF4011 domain-containing protein [Lentisphaerae bacterium]|nr:DUF4011 domain-containing protein [Lentisphaerota bacterium]